ncbi:Peroxiredoxin [Sphingobacterium nematocida]|uniref:Peroxiredoxin n=1 Tax=Sphingobacterium nematocida TaxID=1513896 RepID=A0A1T5ATU5_9SPHI|nr:TlpA disulfide reductase family protein [Sphingobacterium nematocida]SKB38424.1 Peroxiredoxin [Sphingobacterium nematocida]
MNHKIITYSTLLFSLLISNYSYAQEQFTIKGRLTDPRFEGREIYIHMDQQKIKAIVKKGKFVLTGKVKQPIYTSLSLNQDSLMQIALQTGDTNKIIIPASQMIFVEKGEISFKGRDFTDVVVKGTPSNDGYLDFKKLVDRTIAKRKLQSATAIKNLEDSLSLVFIEKNPSSFVALPMIMSLHTPYFVSNNMEKIEAIYNTLGPNIKQRYHNLLMNKVKEIKSFGIGSLAPNFSIKSVNGANISLSDYQGRYVLVEFWAHYCKPCIKEIPFMKEAYQAYKDKNFNILQISVDRPEHHDKWLRAVEAHTSDWDNAIDNQDLNKAAKTKYKVFGIPANFLIDPQGKIVAIDLKGDNLKNTLKSLLN